MNATEFRNQLISEIKQLEKDECKYMAQMIANDLTQEARNAIVEFYSWKPEYYIRNYNFWKAFKKVHINKGEKRVAGVELMIDSFPNDYIRKSTRNSLLDNSYKSSTRYFSYSMQRPEDVYFRVVYGGWHGIASLQGNAPTMSPSPYEKIIDKQEEIIKNQEIYKRRAEELAFKNGNYSILQY